MQASKSWFAEFFQNILLSFLCYYLKKVWNLENSIKLIIINYENHFFLLTMQYLGSEFHSLCNQVCICIQMMANHFRQVNQCKEHAKSNYLRQLRTDSLNSIDFLELHLKFTIKLWYWIRSIKKTRENYYSFTQQKGFITFDNLNELKVVITDWRKNERENEPWAAVIWSVGQSLHVACNSSSW